MAEAPCEAVWESPDGREAPLRGNVAHVDVADGLRLVIRVGMEASTRLAMELALEGESAGRDPSCTVRSRFVVIPLDASSLLVGIAEASATPAFLIPTAARPFWAVPDGGQRMGEGRFVGRSAAGERLALRLTPAPELEGACVLEVTSSSRQAAGLSIATLGPEALRILTGSTPAPDAPSAPSPTDPRRA